MKICLLNTNWLKYIQNPYFDFTLIQNVSHSTSHKKTPSFRLYLRELKKNLPNTFIYESIFINTQIFNLIKYYLNGH